ncbi:MAG: DNA polymerase III subunit gamma/tau, partial [Actinobacteria bacterium]|nr:DNA polymerase III subunit gamma/tau [Actinomycetota bacterium]
AVQLLGFTDGALLDDAVDAIAARDASTLFMTVDRLIEAGHDPRRFAQDLLERIRDLIVVDALEGEASNVLREYPGDQLERMGSQSKRIGQANLSRAAEIISEGLLQMRGTTPPRLIIELICGRISLPAIDSSHEGLLARVERLERVDGISNIKTTVPVQENKVEKPSITQPKKEKKIEAQVRTTPKSSDLSSLRRMWPEVIENVKKRRRLTWSLLSASAQIIDADDSIITIGIVNSGARDSFVRSESDVILAAAFQDVVGIERKIEVIVDSSINPNSSAAKTMRVDEDPSDENQLTGKDLLMKELGARVISESE